MDVRVMTMTTKYELTAAPKHADFHAHNCLICGHEELTKPIWLRSSTGTVFAAGATCAAKALYGDDTTRNRNKVRTASTILQHKADEDEAMRVERSERFARALEAFRSDDWANVDLRSAQKVFHAMKPGVDFPTYMAQVAGTGTL